MVLMDPLKPAVAHPIIIQSYHQSFIVSLMIHRIVTEQFHLRDLTSTDRMFCTSGAFTRINLSGFKIQRCKERLRDRKMERQNVSKIQRRRKEFNDTS